MDAPPARGSENLGSLWQSLNRPLPLRRQLSLPNLFTKSTDALAHEWPSLPLNAFSPVALLPQVLRQVSIQRHKLILIAPLWRNQPWVSELFQLLKPAPWPIPLRRDILSQVNGTIWHPQPELCVAARREPFVLPECVLNTMTVARAPSTRRLYALKWSIFLAWCLDRDLEPDTSDVSMVLSFLQGKLDKQRSCSSTIKVYVAAIAAFHFPISGQSVGRDSAVTQFLRGARRMNSPRPRTVPPWDLPTVLRALKGPPFEPLQSSSLRVLSLKTAVSTGIGQASRRPASLFHQPCLPEIWAQRFQVRPETKVGLCT